MTALHGGDNLRGCMAAIMGGAAWQQSRVALHGGAPEGRCTAALPDGATWGAARRRCGVAGQRCIVKICVLFADPQLIKASFDMSIIRPFK
jgi:hypothetical protein